MTTSVGGEKDLAFKIARLVEERGWNQEDFARIAKLNRHTVRQILHSGPERRLRNATVCQCAEGLGLTVSELRTFPLDRLLPRMHGKPPANEDALKVLQTSATLPDLIAWLERNNNRAEEFLPEEITEILTMQEPGGAMEGLGVEQCIETIERRRRLIDNVRVIAGSEYIDHLEAVVQLMFDKITMAKHLNGHRRPV